jgi:hypothetical protein
MQMEDSQKKERGNCSCELVEKEEEEGRKEKGQLQLKA